MADDIAQWLDGLGLGRYVQAFAENDIDLEVLTDLDDADLEKLGVSMGHRKKLLRAIVAMFDESGADQAATAESPPLTPSAPEAERRQLTVMFCDLVGSTALSSHLDPEDMREVIRAYQDTCAKVIARYDGFIAKYMGDGVLVYFGYPTAHEDDAERAINAGLGIVEAVKELERDLAVRVGIATGMVVVGDIVGEGVSREAAITGETPNLAARLQQIANPDAVVIAETTHVLAGGLFELVDLGDHDLKGFAEPVQVWSVTGLRRAESRFDATRAESLTELIGRNEEIEILERRWRRAQAGEGQVVLISGEPGIGKSRLVRELEDRIADEPHHRLRHQCSPYHTNSALYPIIERLERVAGFETGDDAETKLAKLEALIDLSDDPIKETAPLFATLLSIPTGERYAPLNVSPQRQKELTLQALIDQPAGIAGSSPALFVLEDAHWIDPTTLELMELMVEQMAEAAVLLLITYRPEFQAPWMGRARVTAMHLGRLEQRDCALMVERVASDEGLSETLRNRIANQTDGVPLFVEELTKSVLEVASESDGSSVAVEVPATLQDSLEARLDRLGPAKEIAQIGAVIGRTFDYGLLSHVAPIDEKELRAALDVLVSSGLTTCRGETPDASYTFKHALIQDTAYGSFLRGPRADLHARIASILEERYPELAETEPETLGHHYTEAGLTDPAIAYWCRAGRHAANRSTNAEAVAHFERGLGLLGALAESSERDERELDIQIDLTGALMAAKGYTATETERAHRRALELCERIGDTPKIFPVLYGRYSYIATSSRSDEALAYAEDYLRLAQRQGDDVQQMIGHRMVGMASLILGRPGTAREHLDQAVARYDFDSHGSLTTVYGHDVLAAALAQRGIAEWILGYPDRAIASEHQALEHTGRIDHANSVGYSLGLGVLNVFGMVRDFVSLGGFAKDTLSLVEDFSLPFWQFYGRFRLAQAQFEEGNRADGIKGMSTAFESASDPRVFLWGNYVTVLADAFLRNDDKVDALRLLDDAEAAAETDNERWSEPEIYRIRGDLAVSDSLSVEAEAHYRRAIEIARSQDAKSWELRAATRLARLWHAEGKDGDARDLLSSIYDWFTEGFDTADLKDAKALLKGLS